MYTYYYYNYIIIIIVMISDRAEVPIWMRLPLNHSVSLAPPRRDATSLIAYL